MVELLEKGGIMNMMNSVAMTIIAMMFGGIMEGTHQLEVVVNKLKKLAKGPAGLVTLTEITCVISNMTMPEQYISIVVPAVCTPRSTARWVCILLSCPLPLRVPVL